MIKLNGHNYKLCLLDTNVVSEMIKRPTVEFRTIFNRFIVSDHLLCLSVFTIIELRRSPQIYEKFLDFFSFLPSIFLKGYEQLLEAEIDHYPDPSNIDPTLVAPWGIQLPPGMTRKEALAHLFETQMFCRREQKWQRSQASILRGMLSLLQNYSPRKDGRYTPMMISGFVKKVTSYQIKLRAPQFFQKYRLSEDKIEVDAFPSVKMMTFNVFYKFYPDRRKALKSDVLDIIISSAIPYVDVILTEKHQAEILRKTKKQDHFIDQVEVFTLADLRPGNTISA